MGSEAYGPEGSQVVMSREPVCPDGWYTATASNVRLMETSDGMPFVQVSCTLVSVLYRHATIVLPWRGSLTRGATARTYDALCAMGSRMVEVTSIDVSRLGNVAILAETMLDSVGSRPFRVHVCSLLCDDAEAMGKWRTFVIDVKANPVEHVERWECECGAINASRTGPCEGCKLSTPKRVAVAVQEETTR